MRSIIVRIALLVVCLFMALGDGPLLAAEDLKGTLQGFSFEVPGKNGSRCAVINGTNAIVAPGGIVEVSDIKTKIFCEDGREVYVTSDKGIFDRNSGEVRTESPVRIVSKDMIITGRGLLWHPNNKLIQIKEHVRVEMTSSKDAQWY